MDAAYRAMVCVCVFRLPFRWPLPCPRYLCGRLVRTALGTASGRRRGRSARGQDGRSRDGKEHGVLGAHPVHVGGVCVRLSSVKLISDNMKNDVVPSPSFALIFLFFLKIVLGCSMANSVPAFCFVCLFLLPLRESGKGRHERVSWSVGGNCDNQILMKLSCIRQSRCVFSKLFRQGFIPVCVCMISGLSYQMQKKKKAAVS